MATRPKSIQVLGRRVNVHYSIPKDQPQDVMGLWYQHETKIHLHPGMSPDHTKATLMHELCHEFEHVCQLNMTEKEITLFSAVLFGTLRENPELVAWLMEK
jgi:Zn-dependent peptidase ImmA (M78 family)